MLQSGYIVEGSNMAEQSNTVQIYTYLSYSVVQENILIEQSTDEVCI